MVLSRGSGGNHAVWYQQVPSQKYRVVTWDQRGFGRSTDVNKHAGPGPAVEDLKTLLDHLGITRAHLVGQSMGGWAARAGLDRCSGEVAETRSRRKRMGGISLVRLGQVSEDA